MTGVIEPHHEDVGLGVREEFVWHPHDRYEYFLATTCEI